MPLTTTCLPEGIISHVLERCIPPLYCYPLSVPPNTPFESANNPRNTVSPDFLTICCDGDTKSSSLAIFGFDGDHDEYPVDLANLICCRRGTSQHIPGRLLPILEGIETICCPVEIKTPLASLAATNSKSAAPYRVTYESASAGTADWTNIESPTCLWVKTTHPRVTRRMVPVEVEAARITTLPLLTTHDARYPGPDLGFSSDAEGVVGTSTWERTVLHGSGGSKVTGSVYKGGGQTWGPAESETTPALTSSPAAGMSTNTKTSTAGKACGIRLGAIGVFMHGLISAM